MMKTSIRLGGKKNNIEIVNDTFAVHCITNQLDNTKKTVRSDI